MAGKEVSELSDLSSLASGDLFPVYDLSESLPEKVKKVTWTNLISNIGSAVMTLTNKTLAACTLSGTMNAADNTLQRAKFLDTSETLNNVGTKSSSFNIDLTLGNVAAATLSGSGALTITLTNPPATASSGILALYLTNGGLRTLTWTNVTWSGGVAPSLTSTGVDVLIFLTSNAGSTWLGSRIWKTV